MLEGFKKFIMRGNVIDLAVGVIIAGAFGPIVSNLTDKVLMPLISAIVGQPNFNDALTIYLGKTPIEFGYVITAIVNFLIVAAALYFFVVMPMNKVADLRAKKEEKVEEDAPVLSDEAKLLIEIRDALQGSQR